MRFSFINTEQNYFLSNKEVRNMGFHISDFSSLLYLPDICSSCFMIIFLTISPPMLPACAEVKSPL